ncbi:MAG TPA: hypothetical protein VIR63_03485 [Pontiella sp.]
MKKLNIVLYCSLLLSTLSTYAMFQKVDGIESVHIRRVATSQVDPDFIAVASDNTLYISIDHGSNFTKIFTLKDDQATHLFIDPQIPNTIYLSGSRSCYKISDGIVKRIFSARDQETISFIKKHKNYLYVASSNGFYYSEESQENWVTASALRDCEVFFIEGFSEDVFLASNRGVYRFHPDGTLIRLFTVRGNSDTEFLRPQLLKFDLLNPSRLWLGTNKGLFCSNDNGKTWKKFHISGVDTASINCIAFPPLQNNTLYLCTDTGLLRVNLNSGTSQNVFEGISTSKITWMDFDISGEIYLATDRGLFKTQAPPARSTTHISLYDIMKDEVPIKQIQSAAMRYNSVHPEKLIQWRKRLKYKALLPKLSVDYDNNIRGTIGKDYNNFAEGPDEWGVSLTWELDELIWPSDETTIDNRNKLTTQLRLDILDEINRIYFERIRLKREIAGNKLTWEDSVLKELRLQELTATLDGYTGGWFSAYQQP